LFWGARVFCFVVGFGESMFVFICLFEKVCFFAMGEDTDRDMGRKEAMETSGQIRQVFIFFSFLLFLLVYCSSCSLWHRLYAFCLLV